MKTFIALTGMLICVCIAKAQTAKTTWSDEFKMKKGSTDLSVIYADKTGVYVKEGHLALKTYFVIGATARESATLVKLDKNFTEEYRNDFNKELKGKEFQDFFFIENKAYVIASQYSRKNKELEIFTAEISKSDGKLSDEWKSLTIISAEERNDAIDVNFAYNADSSKMIVVSTDRGKEKCVYAVEEFDSKMKKIGKTTQITNAFEPKTFQLEDVIYTVNGNIVMVGRVYDYAEGKKKKSRYLEFQHYNIQMYSNSGSLIKEIKTDVNAKWLISSKVAQIPNKELIIAAFYSDDKKAKEVNGMMVQRINATNGEIISTSQKEINTSMISAIVDGGEDDGDDDESKKERKEREKFEKMQADEGGFSKYLRFRNFIYTEDNGIVALAEKYNHYTYTTMTTTSTGTTGMMSTRTTTYDVYECGDMMMSKIDAGGQINWLHILPKNQREVIQSGSGTGSSGLSFSMGNNYFGSYSFPFYAGLGSMPIVGKNSLAIMFNDSDKNDKVLQLGQKVQRTMRFGRSECYMVILDAATGKYTRTSMFSNRDQPTAMPRLGVALGNDYYIVGKEDKILGKSKIAVGKIVMK